jgi:colanic acid biosynthesis protein WcaH
MDNKKHKQGYQHNLPGFVPKDTYLKIMENTQIISADLIIFNNNGKVLLGKRTGEPAKDMWFVPGGRIRKNETFPDAVRRIFVQEIGIVLDKRTNHPEPIGVYHQTYSKNFDNDNFNAHYITFAYSMTISNEVYYSDNIVPKPDHQHSEFKWWSIQDILKSDNVHNYCKNYFHPQPWNKINC